MYSMSHRPRPVDFLPGSCFVSGMDVGDNERLATLAMVQALRYLGLRVAAMTPLAVDGFEHAGSWTSPHLELLRRAGSFHFPAPALSPYVLPAASTPLLAAQEAGLQVDAEAVVETFQVLSTWADAIVVEGVGGLSVPLGPLLAVHDVARRLALPLVLALRADDGAPSRARRALALASAGGIEVAGWVATGITPNTADMVAVLADCVGMPALGALPPHARDGADAIAYIDLQAVQQALAVPPSLGAAPLSRAIH